MRLTSFTRTATAIPRVPSASAASGSAAVMSDGEDGTTMSTITGTTETMISTIAGVPPRADHLHRMIAMAAVTGGVPGAHRQPYHAATDTELPCGVGHTLGATRSGAPSSPGGAGARRPLQPAPNGVRGACTAPGPQHWHKPMKTIVTHAYCPSERARRRLRRALTAPANAAHLSHPTQNEGANN
jgi:hypothetical protein